MTVQERCPQVYGILSGLEGHFNQTLLQIPSQSLTQSREQSERISPMEIAKFSKGALNGDLQSPCAALQAASSFFIWLQAFLWENPPSF